MRRAAIPLLSCLAVVALAAPAPAQITDGDTFTVGGRAFYPANVAVGTDGQGCGMQTRRSVSSPLHDGDRRRAIGLCRSARVR